MLSGFVVIGLARQNPSTAGAAATRASAGKLPTDILDSGFRLPLLKRDDLDDEGKKVYDAVVSPTSNSLAGLRGPSGILLYNPRIARLNNELNQYLRYGAGLNGSVRELAILVTAREANSQFEWTNHEPRALKEGLDPKIIDVVKYRKSTKGLPETEAIVIQLGRELFGKNKVGSDTFARALKLFGPRPLVNLVSLMGHYCQTAALLTAFDVQLPSEQKPLLPLP